MADLVTKLYLDNKNFDRNLSKSTQQVQGFQKKTKTASNSVSSAFGAMSKAAGAIGIATLAVQGFNRIIDSCQILTDSYGRSIEGLKTVTDSLFTSMATGDFSAFNDGLDGLIKRATAAYDAMDQLGNTLISYDLKDVKIKAKIQENRVIAMDKDQSKKARSTAYGNIFEALGELRGNTAILIKDLQTAITTKIRESTGLNAQFSIKDIETVIELDASRHRDTAKLNARKNYEEYERKSRENSKTIIIEGLGGTTQVRKNPNYDKNKQAILDKEYSSAILINTLLTQYSDEELKSISAKLKMIYAKKADIDSQEASLARQINAFHREKIEPDTTSSSKSTSAVNYDRSKDSKYLDPVGSNKHSLTVPSAAKVDDKFTNDYKGTPIIEADPTSIDYLNTIGALMGNISGATSNAASAWLQYSTGILTSAAAMLPLLASIFQIKSMNAIAEQGKLPFPLNIIAMAATGAGLAASIASIPKFADGGIVSGSSFVGDNINARLNSGEMVLNTSQQSNLFNLLNAGSLPNNSNSRVEFKVSGKNLIGVLSNQINKYNKYK